MTSASLVKAEFKKLKKENTILSEKIIKDICSQCIEYIQSEKLNNYLQQRKRCCVTDCSNTDLLVFYCKNCKRSHIICSADFRGRTRSRICPVCETRSITLRCAQRIN